MVARTLFIGLAAVLVAAAEEACDGPSCPIAVGEQDQTAMLQIELATRSKTKLAAQGNHKEAHRPLFTYGPKRVAPMLDHFRHWHKNTVDKRASKILDDEGRVALLDAEGRLTARRAQDILQAHRDWACPAAAAKDILAVDPNDPNSGRRRAGGGSAAKARQRPGRPAGGRNLVGLLALEREQHESRTGLQNALLRTARGRVQYMAVFRGALLAADPPACPKTRGSLLQRRRRRAKAQKKIIGHGDDGDDGGYGGYGGYGDDDVDGYGNGHVSSGDGDDYGDDYGGDSGGDYGYDHRHDYEHDGDHDHDHKHGGDDEDDLEWEEPAPTGNRQQLPEGDELAQHCAQLFDQAYEENCDHGPQRTAGNGRSVNLLTRLGMVSVGVTIIPMIAKTESSFSPHDEVAAVVDLQTQSFLTCKWHIPIAELRRLVHALNGNGSMQKSGGKNKSAQGFGKRNSNRQSTAKEMKARGIALLEMHGVDNLEDGYNRLYFENYALLEAYVWK